MVCFLDPMSTASALPPYCLYDCTIDLHCTCRIYPLEEFVQEALQQGYIILSTSPVPTGFFFCGKERWGSLSLYQLLRSHPGLIDVCSAYNLFCILEGDE